MFQSILGPIRGPKALLKIGPIWPNMGAKSQSVLYKTRGFRCCSKVFWVPIGKKVAFLGVCKARSERHTQKSLQTPVNIV